ncbi:MAG: hypothetical protein ACLPX5_12950 [Dissulfurispiraceae bacterium]
MRYALIIALTIILLSPCSEYSASAVTPVESESRSTYYEEGGLLVVADSYVYRKQDAYDNFDSWLVWDGILPIQVVVENQGERRVWLLRSNIVLEFSSDNILNPTRTMKLMENPPRASDGGLGLLLGWPLLIASQSQANTWWARWNEFSSGEFFDVLLRKGESAHGYIFFVVPKDSRSMDVATLVLRFVAAEDASTFDIRLPLKGIYIGITPEKDLVPTADETKNHE